MTIDIVYVKLKEFEVQLEVDQLWQTCDLFR